MLLHLLCVFVWRVLDCDSVLQNAGYHKEGSLGAAANRRGAFLNSGSKDVGKDPDWQKGQFIGRKNVPFKADQES